MYTWVAAAGTGSRRKLFQSTSHRSEMVGQPILGSSAAVRHSNRQLGGLYPALETLSAQSD